MEDARTDNNKIQYWDGWCDKCGTERKFSHYKIFKTDTFRIFNPKSLRCTYCGHRNHQLEYEKGLKVAV